MYPSGYVTPPLLSRLDILEAQAVRLVEAHNAIAGHVAAVTERVEQLEMEHAVLRKE